MSERLKNEILVYLRRSCDLQESSLETQLKWAATEAAKYGFKLNFTQSDLDYMLANKLSRHGCVCLDDAITGADMERPGLVELIDESLSNKNISHIFVYMRDRLGRPENPVEMMVIEVQLLEAGLTLVFSDAVATPPKDGEFDLMKILEPLLAYYASGKFLKTHAQRMISTFRNLASHGHRTGGNAPHGFARYLVGPDGHKLQELPKGMLVRQAGCHVKIFPKDEFKIATWLMILELKSQGWGLKRIAAHLNSLGIPSPGAGTIRTDHGTRHVVSGKWCQNTVGELCRNRAILGIQEIGRRSEGAHRRFGPDGPRPLNDNDRLENRKPRVIKNTPDVIVSAPIGFEPKFATDRWQDIQDQMDQRSRNQRGVRRAKDPTKYPLACRVFDLTDGCGSVMYGITSGQRRLYKCGRYQSTAGAECHHNLVDAEALLRCTLRTLTQRLDQHGSSEELCRMFLARAEVNSDKNAFLAGKSAITAARQLVASLSEDLKIVERRMATERDDDRYQSIAKQFDAIKSELKTAQRTLEDREKLNKPQEQRSPDQEVALALQFVEEFKRAASEQSARGGIPPLLETFGIRLGLNFGAAKKGTREVRKFLGGVIAFGNKPLPVPIHGRDNRDDGAPGHRESIGQTAKESADTLKSDRIAGLAPITGDGSQAPAVSGNDRQHEGVSFTKVSRDDSRLEQARSTRREARPHDDHG